MKTAQESSTFSFVEMFAGEAQATMAFRSSSFHAARMDLLYMEPDEGRDNPMDLTSPSGFATLGIENTDRNYLVFIVRKLKNHLNKFRCVFPMDLNIFPDEQVNRICIISFEHIFN